MTLDMTAAGERPMPFADQHDHAGMHADLVAAQSAFGTIRRRRTATIPTKSGGSYSYKYADLADVLAAVRKPLADNGFAIVQDVSEHGAVRTRLLHRSGGTIESGWLALPMGDTAQSAGAAITYARRYSLSALLGIATEADTDAVGVTSAPTSVSGADRGAVAAAGTAPSPTNRYPVDPAHCTHRFPSGAWLPWDADDRCPKCGTPKVSAMEGTTADLGPATGGDG